MEHTAQSAAHKLTLLDRTHLEITGVAEVESFDEGSIIMSTSKGDLTVRGRDLHIETLSLDGGALRVEGTVESLSYEETGEVRGGFFRRLLG